MQNYLARLAIISSFLLLAACSSLTGTTAPRTPTPAPRPVTIYYGAYDTTSAQLTVAALDGSSGALRWRYATNADASAQMVLAAGIVYVISSASLIALDASTGKLLWSNPALANAQVIGAENGVLYANLASSTSSGALTISLTAINVSDGSLRWSHQFHNGEGDLLANGVIYGSDTLTPFGTPTSPHGAMLVALHASDGSLMWQAAQESGYLTPLSVAQGLLYADNSFPMGGPETIEARRVSDGSTAWRFPRSGGHATYLGLQNNALYAMSDAGSAGANQNMYALNATTGAVLWHAEVTPSQQVFADLAPQAIYVGDGTDNALTALNAADGKQLWKTKLGTPGGSANALVTAAAVEDNAVYLNYPAGFAALNASTGAIKWEAQDTRAQDNGGHPIFAVKNGIIYIRSDTGIAARSTQDGRVVWSQDVTGLQSDPIVG